MAVASGTKPAATPPSRGPAESRALAGAAVGLIKRFLTLREGSIIVVTLITLVYFATNTSAFLTGGNFKTLLPYFAPFAIIAAGEVFVMILGGMLFALDGVTLVISHATPVNTPDTSAVGVHSFAQIFGGGTYSELFWALGIVIILQIALSFTRWGIYTVAVGGNRLGAAEAGIRTRRVMIRNFVLCAGLAGFVGILEAVRVTTATPDPSGSNDILFQAVSAAIIGGTLMTGGAGTIVGALIGALFLGILHDGLIIKGVNANYLDLYLGIAILIAMSINVYVQRVRTGSGHG
jgi:simple sugar transport system permease protein